MLFLGPNNAYPRFIGDIKLEHPGYDEGQPLPDGWFLVEETTFPNHEFDEVVEEVLPVLFDGRYKQTFNVRPATSEEMKRRNAPITLKQKLIDLGLTDDEIEALRKGLIR
jgi:hypothetical protein